MVQKPQSDAERKERRIDLSLPQVAGSAVAAVAAAVMASQLGVYGTIAGAGVMSVVATCGGSVFQHFFRRTGEQIREVTVQVKHPAGRQVTVRTKETSPASQWPQDEATTVLRSVTEAESEAERTRLLRRVPGDGVPVTGVVRPGTPPGGRDADDAYSDARTHGTRVRGWKRSALAATGVFVLSMAGITVYEAASGHGLGGNGGTTVGSVVRGGHGGGAKSPEPSGTGQDDGGDDVRHPDRGDATTHGTDPRDGQSASPGTSGGDGRTEEPSPTPSASSDPATPESTPSAPTDGGTPSAPTTTGAGDAAGPQDEAASGTDTGR
ncbi:hypothetical protein OHT61_24505 [Streptomyces sp. NBC_00178]|uniref:hypothetical protein n=1 Tax=Streptomyces sp. NBC_00178 TaxID=2975672 RepID=UPI002E2B8A74|nr:hypothetical protein [Streptomyces sp. NBC_00178]